jgi:Na+-transporting methylmalonyl-CoA/oxaloacetate decarboxylase gamma subunit
VELKALCNYTVQPDSCPAGALCFNDSFCSCDERYTKQEGFWCTPHVGRVNGRCQLGEEKCSVPGAECPEGSTTCVCQTGMGVDFHTFTCTGVPETKPEEKPNYVVIFFLWVSGIALLIILLTIMAYVYRVSAVQRRDCVMEEMAERRADIVALQDQVHELIELEELVKSGGKRSTSIF